ncbi:MAG: 4Fe-4S single cluster domain-containing protein [Sedimentisphaerales bacterium]|nr:4Fe-4S single cluster domain-containing protein [Sedimentisphaerales bacterium]
MNEIFLNCAHIATSSLVNGPGNRCVVWVQGCSRKCPGCFNPHTHAHTPVRLIDPVILGNRLIQLENITGLTISGGEPFEQAQGCSKLARTFRSTEKSIMVFTGCTLKELQLSHNRHIQEFLAAIDILVAGPYIESLACTPTLWRASSNQILHCLTDLGTRQVQQTTREPADVQIRTDGALADISGFADEKDRRWFNEIVKATTAI